AKCSGLSNTSDTGRGRASPTKAGGKSAGTQEQRQQQTSQRGPTATQSPGQTRYTANNGVCSLHTPGQPPRTAPAQPTSKPGEPRSSRPPHVGDERMTAKHKDAAHLRIAPEAAPTYGARATKLCR